MNTLATIRDELHDCLVKSTQDRGVLPDWRVHPFIPDTVAAPTAWLELVELRLEPTPVRRVMGMWNIYLVLDGGQKAQVQSADVLMTLLWDSLTSVQSVEDLAVQPQVFDVGGPRLRGYAMTVTTQVALGALCNPGLLEVPVPAIA